MSDSAGGAPPRRRQPPAVVLKIVIALRRGMLWLADRLIPAPLVLFERSSGVISTMVIGEVAHLGVADLLRSGPSDARQLAQQLGVNADALHRTLRAASALGLFTLDDSGRFAATALGKTLERDHPMSMRSWAMYFHSKSNIAAWADLGETIRTGQSAFRRVHGCSLWEWFENHPEEQSVFDATMRQITEMGAGAIAAAYPFPASAVVADIGGGVGTLLAQILVRRPDLRGVLVERPAVLADARHFFDLRGLTNRVEIRAGDLLSRVDATADVYLLKNVLHDWDDQACARMLDVVAATMPPVSRLVVVESDQPRNQALARVSLADVHMMLATEGGRERSEAEYASLLRAAGLIGGACYRVPPSGILVTASKPRA